MGIFFTSSQPVMPAVRSAIKDALMVNPATLAGPEQAEQAAAAKTVQLAEAVAPKFNPLRFLAAVVISVALVWAAIWTGHHGLPDISKQLMNSFAGFSGIVLGLLGGEAQKAASA